MDEAEQYLADVGGDLATLYRANPPARRLWGIYRTSRHNMAMAKAARLWGSLQPLRSALENGEVPSCQHQYDEILLGSALAIGNALPSLEAFGGFGIGQKMANLYMKDQWALGRACGFEPFLHAPLDRIVLSSLGMLGYWPSSWRAWTKVTAEGRNSAPVEDYLRIQRFASEVASKRQVQSTIRLEQSIWHSGRGRDSQRKWGEPSG